MVNWTKVLQKCTPSTRKTILHARSTHEELRRMIAEQELHVPKLNFPEYSKILDAKVVKDAEGKVGSWKLVPKDVASAVKALESERDLKLAESSKFVEKLEIRVAALKAQLSRLESAKPVDELSVADVYEVNPEYRDRVYEAIKQDEWSSGASAEANKVVETKTTQPQEKLNYL